MKIGLLFGSFNPVHHGHLLVATLLRESAGLDEVWLVVSPLNPFKAGTELADKDQRLEMVHLAVKDNPLIRCCAIEFDLDLPSYTYRTLKELALKYPDDDFYLLLGEDNILRLEEWKAIDWILDHYQVLVYKRSGSDRSKHAVYSGPSFKFYELPAFDISSTLIRNRIRNGQSIRYFLPESVEQYITFHKLYHP